MEDRTSGRMVGLKRGPKSRRVAAEVASKRIKVEAVVREEAERVVKEDVVKFVKEEAEKVVKEEAVQWSHECAVCREVLVCDPGDMVMKKHYMGHYNQGRLLAMVGDELAEGQKLRCPYADCTVGDKPMKLLLLNIHLERGHARLRRVLERDARPGMTAVTDIIYNYETFKEKQEIDAKVAMEAQEKANMKALKKNDHEPVGATFESTANIVKTEPAAVVMPAAELELEEAVDDPGDPTFSPHSSPLPRGPRPGGLARGRGRPPTALQRPLATLATPSLARQVGGTRTVMAGSVPISYTSSTSTPAPCLLCTDKAGQQLRLHSGRVAEVTEHYKLCMYTKGLLQRHVNPTAINTSAMGAAADEQGRRFQYRCPVEGCERSKRAAKSFSYKEYVFHCWQEHGVMKRALEEAMEAAPSAKVREAFLALIRAVVPPEGNLATLPEARVEEMHTCLLCRGIDRVTKKEKKEAKMLRLNICTTRNHYANCLSESPEGRAWFERVYSTDIPEGEQVKITCNAAKCKGLSKRLTFPSKKMFWSHMALYHGGLEQWMEEQGRQDLRDMLARLVCTKTKDRCFVPDHYGQ